MKPYPDVKRLIPHRHPFIMIDNILEMTGNSVVVEKTFFDNDYGTRDCFVLEGILIEAGAQAVAAKQGCEDLFADKPPGRGMLVSVSNLDFLSRAKTNIPLKIVAKKQTQVGNFSILTVVISQEDIDVARGTLQLFVENES